MDWHKSKERFARTIHLDLTHHQARYAAALREFVRPSVKWLDVGCGHNIVPEWAMPREEQAALVRRAAYLVGADVDDSIGEHSLLTHRVQALGGQLPFRDSTFDLVTANMVVEHVSDSDGFLMDIFRVLRPGGSFLFVTPNLLSPLMYVSHRFPDGAKRRIVWVLEGRKEADHFPSFYRMNEVSAINNAARHAGFQIRELKLIGSVGEFGHFGPLSLVECLLLKAVATFLQGKLQPDILRVLQRPAA